MEAEIAATLGSQAEVQLITGSGGVFDVKVDGEALFSKRVTGRFPEPGEVVQLLGQKQ